MNLNSKIHHLFRSNTAERPGLNLQSVRKRNSSNKEPDTLNSSRRRISNMRDLGLIELFEKAIDVLLKPPNHRSTEDIEHLYMATEKIHFFSKLKSTQGNLEMKTDLVYKCCKTLKYEYHLKGNVIFHAGEPSNKFYVIIKGSVAVLLLKEKELLSQEIEHRKRTNSQTNINSPKKTEDANADKTKAFGKLMKAYTKLQFLNISRIHKSISDAEREKHLPIPDKHFSKLPEKQKTVLDNLVPGLTYLSMQDKHRLFEEGVFKYHCVQQIAQGNVFGELGILTRKSRAATIICTENTHLAVLSRDDYEAILMEIEENKLNAKVQFFSKTLFRDISKNGLTKIVYLFQKKKVSKGVKLFKEDDTPDEMYLIKKGEIELLKKVAKKQPKIEEIQVKTHHKSLINISISILPEGQAFGEEDLVLHQKRSFTAVCKSPTATLYYISNKNFNKMIMERKDILQVLKESAKIKLEWHENFKNSRLNLNEKVSNLMKSEFLNIKRDSNVRTSENDIDRLIKMENDRKAEIQKTLETETQKKIYFNKEESLFKKSSSMPKLKVTEDGVDLASPKTISPKAISPKDNVLEFNFSSKSIGMKKLARTLNININNRSDSLNSINDPHKHMPSLQANEQLSIDPIAGLDSPTEDKSFIDVKSFSIKNSGPLIRGKRTHKSYFIHADQEDYDSVSQRLRKIVNMNKKTLKNLNKNQKKIDVFELFQQTKEVMSIGDSLYKVQQQRIRKHFSINPKQSPSEDQQQEAFLKSNKTVSNFNISQSLTGLEMTTSARVLSLKNTLKKMNQKQREMEMEDSKEFCVPLNISKQSFILNNFEASTDNIMNSPVRDKEKEDNMNQILRTSSFFSPSTCLAQNKREMIFYPKKNLSSSFLPVGREGLEMEGLIKGFEPPNSGTTFSANAGLYPSESKISSTVGYSGTKYKEKVMLQALNKRNVSEGNISKFLMSTNSEVKFPSFLEKRANFSSVSDNITVLNHMGRPHKFARVGLHQINTPKK